MRAPHPSSTVDRAGGSSLAAGRGGRETGRTLIDELLNEQRQLSAVDRFSRNHNSGDQGPAQARYYRDLIPREGPGAGEQYAFSVDLDLCSGCKACVSACHSLNGLDDQESWRSVKSLHGGTPAEPYQQTVTAACHHCVDPACLNGCPVLAYEKDAETGIVRHLDDQCIGCQYCVLKCPYDVPKYSASRGIVRKCDMCHSRLAANEAPACVQACPSAAISIRVVSKSETANFCSSAGTKLIPGMFESDYTQPTTTYISRKPVPSQAQLQESNGTQVEPAHWPLIWMLLLTQTSSGLFLLAWLVSLLAPGVMNEARFSLSFPGFCLLQAGLAASIFHLGRPLGAWRVFLGLRRSWMSREIVAFGIFALGSGILAISDYANQLTTARQFLAAATSTAGFIAVFCSAMIYIDTRRPFWRPGGTFPRFFGTALVLGASGAAVILGLAGDAGNEGLRQAAQTNAWIAVAVRTILFVWESQASWREAKIAPHDSKSPNFVRSLLFFGASVFGLLGIFVSGPAATWFATMAFLATFASRLIERYDFFVAARTGMERRMSG